MQEGMGGAGEPPISRPEARRARASDREDMSNRSVRWRVVEVGPTNDVITHYSDEYNLVLDPINLEFKFRLVFKIRQDHFELYMESLLDRDVELKLGIKIESNSYRRHVKEVFTILGKNDEGHTQYVSLYWGSPLVFLRDLSGLVTRPDVFVEIHFMNLIVRCNRYPKPPKLTSESANNSLPNDMWRAFLAETGADLTITCESVTEDNDDLDDSNSDSAMEQRSTPARATFKVQKGILTSRSEIFAAMFSHGFSEGETGNLHISDMTPQALREMLRFLYTDKMENANIHAKELLRAANKYNIPRMKLLAEEALCQNLSDDTVLLVAKFANVHNGGYAKDFAINCIVSNFGTLIRRPEWADFIKENPDLLHEIHLRISSKMDNGQRHGRSSTTISRYSTS